MSATPRQGGKSHESAAQQIGLAHGVQACGRPMLKDLRHSSCVSEKSRILFGALLARTNKPSFRTTVQTQATLKMIRRGQTSPKNLPILGKLRVDEARPTIMMATMLLRAPRALTRSPVASIGVRALATYAHQRSQHRAPSTAACVRAWLSPLTCHDDPGLSYQSRLSPFAARANPIRSCGRTRTRRRRSLPLRCCPS